MPTTRTAHAWLGDIDFYDPSYYRNVMKHTDLWRMDYHIARVFNTPSYCNNLLEDMHGQIETNRLDTLPTVTDLYEPKLVHSASVNIVVADIYHMITNRKSTEREHSLLVKGFAWFLMHHQLLTAVNIKLPEEVQLEVDRLYNLLNRQYPNVMFFHLENICGTRFSAEKSRAMIMAIVEQLT